MRMYQIGGIIFLIESDFNLYCSYLNSCKIKNDVNIKADFKIKVQPNPSIIRRQKRWVTYRCLDSYSIFYLGLPLAEIILTNNENFLLPLFLSVLSTVFPFLYEGIVLHGSCVEKQNKAYIFLGESRAGKTTIAKLARKYGDYREIADDLVLIRNIHNEFYAFSIPQLKSTSVELEGVKVKKIFFIRESPKNRIKKLNFKNAFGQVLSNIPFIKYFPPEVNRNIFYIVNSLLKSNFFYEFLFLNSPSTVDLIDDK